METAPDERVIAVLETLRLQAPELSLIEPIRVGPERRNAVWRVAFGAGTAVLKVAHGGSLAIERAALAALGGLHAPSLLAGGEGWLLAEDLGATETPAPVVALGAIGAALGAIHAATRGFAWEQPPVDVDHAIFRWSRGLATFAEHVSACDIRLCGASIRDLGRVERLLSRPRQRRVLTNGDPGPMNAIFREGRAILVDWEVAGPRHPALDWFPAVQHRLRADPRPVTVEEERAFGDGYRRSNPDAGGADEVAAAAIAWAAVAALTLPARLDGDRVQGTVGHRWRIATAIGEASRRSSGAFPALSRDLGRVARALGDRWGVTGV
jgi:hypothetical protein